MNINVFILHHKLHLYSFDINLLIIIIRLMIYNNVIIPVINIQ